MSVVCKKELRRLPLPDVILSEIMTFCNWTTPRTGLWYIVASRLDASRLDRAKQLDTLNTFLANDDEDDMADLFKCTCLDYVNHIRRNRTI